VLRNASLYPPYPRRKRFHKASQKKVREILACQNYFLIEEKLSKGVAKTNKIFLYWMKGRIKTFPWIDKWSELMNYCRPAISHAIMAS